jgi:hypothetical protein
MFVFDGRDGLRVVRLISWPHNKENLVPNGHLREMDSSLLILYLYIEK